MDEYIRYNGSRIKNIRGQHFGHLIPQKIVGVKNKYAIWECLCDLCGGTRQVSVKLLKGGSATMCEKCIKEKRRELLNKNCYNADAIAFKDLTRKQFGFWTVLKKGEYKNNTQMWVCKCKCGTIKEVSPYPETCDYEFCKLLKERGISLPFTGFNEKRTLRDYYGFTLEDM